LTRFKRLLAREFNLVTPENDLKHDHVHPGRAVYRFEPADSIVAFADSAGMRVRGHTLVWHSQLASWLTSGTWTQAEARTLLQEHITTVVGHYRGRLLAWDVVNEALADDGSLRSTFWLTRIGREYIELAFRAAREADPGVALFYNDYNIEGINAKSDSAYALIRDLRARGVPIDGVGLQAHFVAGGVPATLGQNIARFAALGIKVHITELDIRVPIPATSTQLQTQAQNYRDVVQTCLSSPACEVISVWGLTDRESWIPSVFTGFGEALLFDSSYQPKAAYFAVYGALKP
jgi:endo-1,4-beta-xylanase